MSSFLPYDRLTWLLSAGLGREKLALLTLCALAIYVLTEHLTWRLVHVGTGRKFVVAFGHSWVGRWLAQLLRLLYYVGIPFAVLWRGELFAQMGIPTTYAGSWDGDAALRLLGLIGVQDVAYLGTGVATAIGTLCLLGVVWTWYVRAVPGTGGGALSVPWWRAFREAFFLQMLWAFYRGVVNALTLDGVRVAFISLALVSASWLLTPRRRHDLFTPRGYLVVQDWLCALFTAFVSLIVRSLWLLIIMHMLWIWVGGQVLARLSQVSLGTAWAED
jgi:hypothetical protein